VPAPPVIDYRGGFEFAVTPDELWSSIEHVEEFERWWPWLQEFTLEGGSLRRGAVMHGVVAPPLPYRINVDVELVACRRPTSIDAVVHRDLEGTASLRIRPSGPAGCTVEAEWSVEMMQKPMRLASRFAHPLLRWGHDRVVEITVRSFRRHLESSPHIQERG
jgi:carbon monoxide dehydrogenase subunit G